MARRRGLAAVVAMLCVLAVGTVTVGTAQAFNAPLVGYGAADGSLICDTVNEINPTYSDVACASGSSGWIGASGSTVSFGLVTEIDPRDSGNGGPLDSMAYVVAIAVNGVQVATVGVNGKEVNNADYMYAKCFGQTDNYDKLVTTAMGDGSFAVTAMTGTPYYRVDWDIPLASLTACGITPTTNVQLYYGTSAAANLDVINKDYFRTGDSSVNFAGLATIQLGGSLGLTKTVTSVSGPNPPAPGQTSTFDLTVTAHDSSMYALSNVQVVDDLPAGVQLLTQAASSGTVTVTGQHVDWSGFGMASAGSQTLVMRVSITPSPSDVGSAVLLNSGATGTALRGDNVSVSATSNSVSSGVVSGPLLSLTKTASPSFVAAGGTVTYTLTIGNSGNTTASLTSLVDTLPTGFSFVPGSTGGTLGAATPSTSGSAVTWSGAWSLAAGATKTLTFSAVSSGTGGTYTNTATVNASNAASATTGPTAAVTVDSPPTATADAAATARATAVTVDVLANDSDPNGNALSVTTVSTPSAGTAVIDASAQHVVYTPPAGFSGPATFTYTISDGYGGTATATVTVTVANAAPTAVDDTVTAASGVGTVVDVLANDTDPDGDALQVAAVSTAQHGVTTFTATGVTYTPASSYAGPDSFTYTVSDGHGGSATATVTVTVPNTPPTAGADSAATLVGVPVTVAVLANDTDPNTAQTLTASAPTSPQHGTADLNADGTITYTPSAGYFGPDSFDYTVSDGDGGSALGTVNVTVTAGAPIAVDDSDTTATDTAVDVAVLLNDVGVSALSVVPGSISAPLATVPVGPPSGSAGTATLNPDGTVRFTPAPGFTGTASFTYDVTDGTLTSASPATVRITVEDGAPVAVDDAFPTADRTGGQVLDVLANDSDPNGDVLTITGVTAATSGAQVEVSTGAGPGGRDVLLYSPPAGFTGSDAFSYTVSDGRGKTATASVSVTVPDQQPVPVDDAASPSTAAAVTIDVLGNDSDPDGDALVVTGATPPTSGSVVVNADSTVTYTPNAGFTGTDSFDYAVSDGHGGTATATVTVDVPNTPPSAVDDTGTATIGTPTVLDVLANDSDVNPGQVLVVTAAGPAGHGTVAVNPDGTVTYTPAGSYQGPDSFAYTISDGAGGTASASVSVTTSGRPPVAVDDATSTATDTAVTVAVLANDSDPDGDAMSVVPGSVTLPLVVVPVGPSGASAGTAVLNPDGTVTYTPTTGFTGTAGFDYTVTDGTGTATASVRITVLNASPVAVDDSLPSATRAADQPIDVLANDTDPNSDPLTITAVSGVRVGATVTIDPTGGPGGGNQLLYTPAPGFTGTDTFSYSVSDGRGGSDSATVTVSVGNSLPSAVDDAPPAAATRGPITVTVLANDSDPDGDPLTVTATSNATSGTAVVNADQTVTFTPSAAYAGPAGFDYTISDGLGGTSTAHVTLTIPNGAPTAVPDAAATTAGAPVTVDVLANDTDPDGDPLTVVPGSVTTSNGTVLLNPNGTVTYTPPSGFSGAATSSYTVTDGLATSPGTLTVTVAAAVAGGPVAPVAPVASPPSVVVTAPVNQPPSYTDAPVNTGQTIVAGDPLAPLAATDPDGNSLTYALVSGQLPPGVQLQADGSFTGTATAAGSYAVVLRVCDDGAPQLCSDTALVVSVEAAATGPTAPPAPVRPGPVPPSPAPSPAATRPVAIGQARVEAAPARPLLPHTGAPLAALLLLGLASLLGGLGITAGARRRRGTDTLSG